MDRTLIRSPLFWLGIVIRLLAIPVFAGHFPEKLFIPFLDSAVQNLGQNPWSLNSPEMFPYGGYLLWILFIPKLIGYWILGDLTLGTSFWGLILFKTPLFLIDFLFLTVLARLAEDRRAALLSLYWLNPVLIFITYVHGQLDIVSMCAAVLALKLVVENRLWEGAVIFGMAVASKFHVAAIAPFVLAYLWNRSFRERAARDIFQFVAISIAVALIGFAPLIFANNVGHATLGSPELARLLASQIRFDQQSVIYLGVVATLLVLGRLVISTRISELGLIFGSGIVLSVLLGSSNPAPGWFFWSLPFLALFYSLFLNVPKSLFFVLQLLYVLHFLPTEVNWGVPIPPLISNSVLTGLQTALFANIVAVWIVVIRRECPALRRARPIRIGLAGDSGAGKNTLTELLKDLFHPTNVALIEGDNYHKWERGDEQWMKYTHLNPKANHLFALAKHLDHISLGRSFLHSHYSHETGKFTAPVETKPARVLIVQGLHSFFLKDLRDRYDMKIFLAPHPLVRKAWKIKRDCIERGYDREKVLAQLEKRGPDSEKYIAAQKGHADVVIEHLPKSENYSDSLATKGEIPEIRLRLQVWNNVDLSFLSSTLEQKGFTSRLELSTEEPDRVIFSLDMAPSAETVAEIAGLIFPTLRWITRSQLPPVWRSGFEGIEQIVCLQVLDKRAMLTQSEEA